jgi:hypothetical protein
MILIVSTCCGVSNFAWNRTGISPLGSSVTLTIDLIDSLYDDPMLRSSRYCEVYPYISLAGLLLYASEWLGLNFSELFLLRGPPLNILVVLVLDK